MRRNEIRALRTLPTGTIVRLPEELGRQVGYTEGGGATLVLVPGHRRLDGFDMPEPALVEVIATPMDLANAYLRGDLGRVDRRWKRRRPRTAEVAAESGSSGSAGQTAGPVGGDAEGRGPGGEDPGEEAA